MNIVNYPILRDTETGITQVFEEDWTWGEITIPKGFETDGTTSPWIFRAFVPRRGPYVFASYIHDYQLTQVSRYDAAQSFLKSLGDLNASKIQCIARYYGVRGYDTILKIKGFFNN